MKNFTKQRIQSLLEEGAFLCAPVGEEEVRSHHASHEFTLTHHNQEQICFSHPAILETVVLFFFPKKARAMTLTSLDIDAFDPMPLPVIVLACSVVSLPPFPLRYD